MFSLTQRKSSGCKALGLAIIVIGALGLAYKTFSYTKDTEKASIGSVKVVANEMHTFNIPIGWSVGAIAVGSILFIL